jgi:hypothetical protein
MRFQGALITEQGITFAVVVVQPHVVGNQKKYDQLMPILQPVFPPDVPIIVMCLNPQGVPLYYGRQDIVNFLVRVPVTAIPWRWYKTKEEKKVEPEEKPPAEG